MTVRVLLSGGIGSGKSTAAGVLSSLGAVVISADEAGRRVLEPGEAAADAVAARWPEVVVEGRIDRRMLGRIVFSDDTALTELESITHPAIRRLVVEQVAEAVPTSLVVVEVPLPIDFLGEGWARIVVDAPDEIRVDRLRAAGWDPEEIAGRMASQPARHEWLAVADHVIDNGGDLARLEAECRRVWSELTGSEPGAGSTA
jgi:dephospho-CoA kinase